MSTTRVNLDVTQYVKVADKQLSLLLQSHRDTVRIAFSDIKPARDNTVFHELGGDDEILEVTHTDTFVWALAMTSCSALTVTTNKSGVDSPVNRIILPEFQGEVITTVTQAVASAPGDRDITLVDSTGLVVGDRVTDLTAASDRKLPIIVAINGNVITLDRGLDLSYPIGKDWSSVPVELNVLGTPENPVIFSVAPPVNETWVITRLLLSMTHDIAGDLGLFGGIPALTYGVQVRTRDGVVNTLNNWKSNGDMALSMYDISFDSRSGGQGDYGTKGRFTFAKSGTVLELKGADSDSLEIVIQDDLTDLVSFEIMVQGHNKG
ncbi:hypothetical protein NVP1021C_05 [Vibrio phage 1.021.C._10N.222.51.F9]|nr:hypothetical protein NVP1021A_05 [Vibrio phage 1.021.A._10N.222.51.F9]AUR82118.1 hypothetical protein NVP1021B_05 [Vibrio phage 1.021.B._10N.222.51.F9]AUR82168.1 hypothetical protein NVP1021C_05 [Vibrio phage 1.021.C._10N.222.51.F9]